MANKTIKAIKGENLTLDEFIDQHMKLVHSISHKYKKHAQFLGIEYQEIVNIGVIGLIKVYNDFDNSYNVSITTYAYPKVAGEIQRALRDNNPGAFFPRTIKAAALKVTEEETDPLQISKKLGVSLRVAKGILEYKQNVKSVSIQQNVVDEQGGGTTIENLIVKKLDETRLHVEEFIGLLDERNKQIVYALLADKTQREIGNEIKCSQVHVSRLLQKIRDQYNLYASGM